MKGEPSITINYNGKHFEFYEYFMDDKADFLKQIDIGDKIVKLGFNYSLLIIKKNGDRLIFKCQGGENNWWYYFLLMPQLNRYEDFKKYNCK
ncbi:MAG: hypothetical protein JNM67_06530 [Bacteroidetes bacterium]|nr:hypothetical protein [Bacteroidota bacterium]